MLLYAIFVFLSEGQFMEDTRNLLQQISDWIHFLLKNPNPGNWILQFLAKLIFLAILLYLLDLFFTIILRFFYRFFRNEEKHPVMASLQHAKVINSLVHLTTLGFARLALYPFFYRHPQSFGVLERLVGFILVLAVAQMAFRILKAVEYYYFVKKDHYRLVAIRAISQTVKIFGILLFSFLAMSIIFGISSEMILGSLGAITAVLVLVFRDTILGFVTGIHVATSRNLKVGDWIGIPKYNMEGTIEDINLLTVKIKNFDRTISTIPTYDLLSTEIKNLQVMSESNTRRIKKSISFNINSFKFIDDELFERLKKINLIHDYLVDKRSQINEEKKKVINAEEITNAETMTNIGVFRIYAQAFLKKNPNLDQTATLLVRQLDITPQGLPLEIYCFATKAKLEEYEQIQSDIFDHLLVASREFDLEILQTYIK